MVVGEKPSCVPASGHSFHILILVLRSSAGVDGPRRCRRCVRTRMPPAGLMDRGARTGGTCLRREIRRLPGAAAQVQLVDIGIKAAIDHRVDSIGTRVASRITESRIRTGDQ